jgi:hypothetical protein
MIASSKQTHTALEKVNTRHTNGLFRLKPAQARQFEWYLQYNAKKYSQVLKEQRTENTKLPLNLTYHTQNTKLPRSTHTIPQGIVKLKPKFVLRRKWGLSVIIKRKCL